MTRGREKRKRPDRNGCRGGLDPDRPSSGLSGAALLRRVVDGVAPAFVVASRTKGFVIAPFRASLIERSGEVLFFPESGERNGEGTGAVRAGPFAEPSSIQKS